jgi:hypothetical protein
MRRFTAAALLLLMACSRRSGDDAAGPTVVPKGNRIIGIHVQPPEDNNYDAAIAKAKSFGTESVPFFATWKSLETSPGVYDGSLLSLVNLYYPAQGLKNSITIATINTNVLEVPSDLAATPWDSPTMISRFNALQDFIFAQIPAVTLTAYCIGNEVDATLSSAADVAAYKTFYDATASHARTLRPGLKVGCTVQLRGLTGTSKALFQSLNAASDIIALTHYPLGPGFVVLPPSSVRADLEAVLAAYPSTPVFVKEIGYPSSATCGSSEELQRQFIAEVFAVWDDHAARIPLLYFFLLSEWSQATVDGLAVYYGAATPEFKEFLRTLGLRSYAGSGSDKPGFTQLVAEAAARGF